MFLFFFVQLRIAKVNPILLLSTCSTYEKLYHIIKLVDKLICPETA